jgi:hypothetical protein
MNTDATKAVVAMPGSETAVDAVVDPRGRSAYNSG